MTKDIDPHRQYGLPISQQNWHFGTANPERDPPRRSEPVSAEEMERRKTVRRKLEDKLEEIRLARELKGA